MSEPEKFDELQRLASAVGLRLTYDDDCTFGDDCPTTIYVYRRLELRNVYDTPVRDALFSAPHVATIHAFIMGWIACQADR